MAIKGLTGRGKRFEDLGKLFKGAPKEKKTRSDGTSYETFGKELNYWRFESDREDIAEAFFNAFGATPRELPVYLPFPTAAENLQTCKEAYTAGGIQHRCDGEVCSLWLDPKTNTYKTTPIPCPTLTMDEAKAKRDGCKPLARLFVFIPALGELGLVTMETHSINDIVNLDSRLPAFESLPQCALGDIPFTLYRYEASISTPRDGKRVHVKKWLVGIRPDSEWAGKYLTERQQLLLSPSITQQPLALTAGSDAVEYEEEGEEVIHEAEIVHPEEPKHPAPKAATNGARSKFGKQILALMVPLRWDDAKMLAFINQECGLESNVLTEAADGITEEEQQALIKKLQVLKKEATA